MTTVERSRDRPKGLWTVLLAAPIVATGYFWVVYLGAETACAEEMHILDAFALRLVIWVAALASLAVLSAALWRARRLVRNDPSENRRFVGSSAMVLVLLFAVFVLFIGAPVVGSSLC